MNWHAGRNICYYSHFLTACAAWIESCSWRKQLSGKSGEIRKRGKTSMVFFCKGSKTTSISDGELRVTTKAAWQLNQTLRLLYIQSRPIWFCVCSGAGKRAKEVKSHTQQTCSSVLETWIPWEGNSGQCHIISNQMFGEITLHLFFFFFFKATHQQDNNNSCSPPRVCAGFVQM